MFSFRSNKSFPFPRRLLLSRQWPSHTSSSFRCWKINLFLFYSASQVKTTICFFFLDSILEVFMKWMKRWILHYLLNQDFNSCRFTLLPRQEFKMSIGHLHDDLLLYLTKSLSAKDCLSLALSGANERFSFLYGYNRWYIWIPSAYH